MKKMYELRLIGVNPTLQGFKKFMVEYKNQDIYQNSCDCKNEYDIIKFNSQKTYYKCRDCGYEWVRDRTDIGGISVYIITDYIDRNNSAIIEIHDKDKIICRSINNYKDMEEIKREIRIYRLTVSDIDTFDETGDNYIEDCIHQSVIESIGDIENG